MSANVYGCMYMYMQWIRVHVINVNPCNGCECTCFCCMFSVDGKKLRLLVVTEGGRLLLYDIDIVSGGEYTAPIKEFE